MEETTGAPSSFAALSPRRLRASSRDGGGVVNRPPSPLTMLLSRHTRRREVIAGLGAAAAWPHRPGRAQQRALPVIGFLSGRSPSEVGGGRGVVPRRPCRDRLRRRPERRDRIPLGRGHYDRLPALAAELVERRVAVLAAVGGSVAGACRQGRDGDDPDRVRERRRPRQDPACREPQPARRQRHRRQPGVRRTWTKAPRALARGGSDGAFGGRARELRLSERRRRDRGPAGRGAYARARGSGSAGEHRKRARARLRGACGEKDGWTPRRRRPFPAGIARPHRRVRRARCGSGHLFLARLRRCRRAHELWRQHHRGLSPGRKICRPDPSRARSPRTCRSCSRQFRARHQSQDGAQRSALQSHPRSSPAPTR